ncbi:hypothetical protein [Paenibacillus sp. Marseille-Q4541]|uniref:hypothetical protein n=1 Tax=Paenibacillus sp. Marseille-Q4541 TaxID=2831522 RepID=UPI001BA9E626|nr:hypothetical protein [Paenibacillus sp. Marseille-Q4541]
MKISKSVIEEYKVMCPASAQKSGTDEIIEYKIRRAVDLGKVVDIRGEEFHIQYFYNIFVRKNNSVVKMYKSNSNDRYINVSERVKQKYDLIHSKVLV